jgi:chromosome segregation ATPase
LETEQKFLIMEACLEEQRPDPGQSERIRELEGRLEGYKSKMELLPIYETQIYQLQEFGQSHGLIIEALTTEKLESDSGLKKKQTELDELLDTFQKNEETYNYRVNDLEITILKLVEKNDELSNALTENDTAHLVVEKMSLIEKFNTELNRRDCLIDSLNIDLDKRRLEMDGLDSDLQKKRHEVSLLTEQIQKMDFDIDSLRQDLDTRVNQKLSEKIIQSEEIILLLKTENHSTKSDLHHFKTQIQTSETETSQLKADLSLIAKEYEYYKSRYEVLTLEHDKFSQQIFAHKEEIFQWEKNYNEILIGQKSVNA